MSYERSRLEKARRRRLPMSSRRRKIITEQKKREKEAERIARIVAERLGASDKLDCDCCGKYCHPGDMTSVRVGDDERMFLCLPCYFDMPPKLYEITRHRIKSKWWGKRPPPSSKHYTHRENAIISMTYDLMDWLPSRYEFSDLRRMAEHYYDLWLQEKL